MYDEVVAHVILNLDDQVDAAGFKVLTWIHVDSPMAQGLSMGTASHAVGTAPQIRRLRQPRPDDERHPDRLADPADTGMDRGHLTESAKKYLHEKKSCDDPIRVFEALHRIA